MRKIYIIAAVLLAVSIVSCTRENEVIPVDLSLKGGRGGLTTVRVTPQLHEKDIDSCVVYIGYAKDERQALDKYDDKMNVSYEEGRPRASFDSLTKGTYYFYLEAYDNSTQTVLKGGAPFTVVDTLMATYDIYLQVAP